MLNPKTTAFLFPGQGSQFVGMGLALAETYPAARAIFDRADALLGPGFADLCWHGPKDTLDDTHNTQPALFVAGMAAMAALQTHINGDFAPAMMAGHSLGELTALTAAGAMGFADGLALVRERGRLMKLAGERNPGGMAAVLGLEIEPLRDLCAQASAETGGIAQVANDNCPGQLVISGHHAAVDRTLELAKAAGARRAIKLAVSIAAHSPLMETVFAEYDAAVTATPIARPLVTVLSNITVEPLRDEHAIRTELSNQLTHPVRWTESIRAMRAHGIDTFVELGAGEVLSGLLKRIDPAARSLSITTPAAIAALFA